MSDSKCRDINKYLTKEIHYLEELINKANNKQCTENQDYWNQCGQIKNINNDLDDHRMRLVKRVITCEDHLGIETGPLDQEQISISGAHKDVADGSFRQTLGSGQ